jgi:hypothetical protein
MRRACPGGTETCSRLGDLVQLKDMREPASDPIGQSLRLPEPGHALVDVSVSEVDCTECQKSCALLRRRGGSLGCATAHMSLLARQGSYEGCLAQGSSFKAFGIVHFHLSVHHTCVP